MTKQSMSYLVSSLEADGFVEIVNDPADARAKLVRLTEKGVQAEKALSASSTSLEAVLSEQIGEDRLEALRSTLIELVECDFTNR